MRLQEHIDQVRTQVIEKINELGLAEASDKIGHGKEYTCRIKTGSLKPSAKKLIDLAKRLGLDV